MFLGWVHYQCEKLTKQQIKQVEQDHTKPYECNSCSNLIEYHINDKNTHSNITGTQHRNGTIEDNNLLPVTLQDNDGTSPEYKDSQTIQPPINKNKKHLPHDTSRAAKKKISIKRDNSYTQSEDKTKCDKEDLLQAMGKRPKG